MSDLEAELARLDAIIAENDRADTSGAKSSAAKALYRKAEIIEGRDGPGAAVNLYAEIGKLLDNPEPESQELLVCALNDAAVIYKESGNLTDSRAMLERIVADYFEDPPEDAIDVVGQACLTLAEILNETGESNQAMALLERVITHYGQPDMPGHRVTAAAAEANVAGMLAQRGKRKESMRRYERVLQNLGDPSDEDERRIFANCLGFQAAHLYAINRIKDADARCRQLIARFDGDPDPEVAAQVAWAHKMLEQSVAGGRAEPQVESAAPARLTFDEFRKHQGGR